MDMYKSYSFIKSPTDNTKIWQYMDLSEFIHLLYSKSLFFCNTKKFGDPFEGSLPLLNNIVNEQKEYQITKKLLGNKKKFKNVIKSQPIIKWNYQGWKNRVLVNCWHMNNSESAAMWNSYSYRNSGIALQSTFKRLKNSIKSCKEEIIIGEVQYLNYRNEWLKESLGWEIFLTKKRPYEYERELRALNIVYDSDLYNKKLFNTSFSKKDEIILDKDQTTKAKKILSMNNKKGFPVYIPGKLIKINLDNLIESIYVSPYVDDYFIEVINSLIEKYDISNKDIILSELYYKKNNS
jgi:hypothetical protein